MIYLDTSVLVKVYVQEEGSEVVRSIVQKEPVASSVMALAEFTSAIWRKVREEGFNQTEASQVLQEFLEDVQGMWIVPLVDGRGEVVREAMRLCREEALRASDSIHLATALVLSHRLGDASFLFLSADQRLTEAATRSGVRTRSIPV